MQSERERRQIASSLRRRNYHANRKLSNIHHKVNVLSGKRSRFFGGFIYEAVASTKSQDKQGENLVYLHEK